MTLPTEWVYYESKKESGSLKQVIYALTIDKQRKNYQFYATDFESVWKEGITAKEIAERARTLGMEDAGKGEESSEYKILLDALESEASVQDNKNVALRLELQRLVVALTGDITWNFYAIEQTPPEAARFFAQFNTQLFSKVDFLQYTASVLEELLQSKDHYISFLTENYRAVNGDELLKKYRGGDGAKKYSKSDISSRILETYNAKKGSWSVIKANLKNSAMSTDRVKDQRSPSSEAVSANARETSPSWNQSTPAMPPPSSSKKRRIGGMTIGKRVKRDKQQASELNKQEIEEIETQVDTFPDRE